MGIDHGTINETYEDKKRREFVEGLRKLADLFETTDLQIPYSVDPMANVTKYKQVPVPNVLTDEWPNKAPGWENVIDEDATARELAKIVQTLSPYGNIRKAYTDTYFELHFDINDKVKLQYYANRQSICKKRVVGTRVIPERTVEDVEWDCTPISFKGFELNDD
jgi:hypothetical protein